MPNREGYVQVNLQLRQADVDTLKTCRDRLQQLQPLGRITQAGTVRAALAELDKYLTRLERDRSRPR